MSPSCRASCSAADCHGCSRREYNYLYLDWDQMRFDLIPTYRLKLYGSTWYLTIVVVSMACTDKILSLWACHCLFGRFVSTSQSIRFPSTSLFTIEKEILISTLVLLLWFRQIASRNPRLTLSKCIYCDPANIKYLLGSCALLVCRQAMAAVTWIRA